MAQLPTFIVDTREKNGFNWKSCTKWTSPVVQKLDTGDYSVVGKESLIVVERKGAPSELMGNLIGDDKKRFHAELERLTTYKRAWIVCEFTMRELLGASSYVPRHARHHFSPDKLLGAIGSLMAKYNVPILFTDQPRTFNKAGRAVVVRQAKLLTEKLLLKAHKYVT